MRIWRTWGAWAGPLGLGLPLVQLSHLGPRASRGPEPGLRPNNGPLSMKTVTGNRGRPRKPGATAVPDPRVHRPPFNPGLALWPCFLPGPPGWLLSQVWVDCSPGRVPMGVDRETPDTGWGLERALGLPEGSPRWAASGCKARKPLPLPAPLGQVSCRAAWSGPSSVGMQVACCGHLWIRCSHL